METIYLVCAVIGATFIVGQFLLTLLGLGHGHDFGHDGADHDFAHDADHDTEHEGGHEQSSSSIFRWLTFRSMSASLAFFGLTGLSTRRFDVDDGPGFLLALAAGAGALMIVGWLMRMLTRLNLDGTVRIDRAVGSRGTVYLSIPGQREGAGKVHVSCHDRLLEYKAVTATEPLATGTKIVVVGVVSGDTVEVAPAPEPERLTHA